MDTPSTELTSAEIKRALIQAGLEIYRTRGDVVHVAERVRENLIMDSGVRVEASGPAVVIVWRAQRSDFPNEGNDALFVRVAEHAEPASARGFVEVGRVVTPVMDPGDSGRVLDTWCELSLRKSVPDLAATIAEVRFALSVDKAVAGR